MSDKQQRILILGGGFAGVYTAMYLEKGMTKAERERIHVTLVSHENYIVFQPFLPEIISGTIEMLHVITPIRRLAKRSKILTREIEEIDLNARRVRLAPEFIARPMFLEYDHIVLGMGTRLAYHMVPGMAEHAIPFKYLGDGLRLRNAVVGMLEEADNETDPEEKKKLLTFVVGGGGFSGTECIAELNDFLKEAVRSYTNVKFEECRTVLLQSADRILPEITERLATYAHEILTQRGVDIRLHTRLTAVTAEEAIIKTKGSDELEMIPTRTIVATVPSAPHPLVAGLADQGTEATPFVLERGRIVVNEFLEVPEWPGVWSVGDCAAVPQKDGITSPPTAQHALRQAKTCATNILATIRAKEKKPFLFTGLGKLASLGRHQAVAEVLGVRLKGVLAWLMWRGIYLSKFPGFDRKIRIMMDWAADLVLPRDITEVRIFEPEAVVQEHFHEGDLLFSKGDFGDKVYCVASGEVEIIRDGVAVATLKQGDIFGEVALIRDDPRNADVRAVTAVDVITVSRDAFQKLIKHLPGVESAVRERMRQKGFTDVDFEQAEQAEKAEKARQTQAAG